MTCVIYTPIYLPDAPRLYLKYTPVQLTIPAKWSQVPRFVQMVVFVFVQQSALAFECKHKFSEEPYITRDVAKFGGGSVLHHPGMKKFRVLHRASSDGADDYQVFKDLGVHRLARVTRHKTARVSSPVRLVVLGGVSRGCCACERGIRQDSAGSFYIGSPSLGNVIRSVYVADLFANPHDESVHDSCDFDRLSASKGQPDDDGASSDGDAPSTSELMSRVSAMEDTMKALVAENERLKASQLVAANAAIDEAAKAEADKKKLEESAIDDEVESGPPLLPFRNTQAGRYLEPSVLLASPDQPGHPPARPGPSHLQPSPVRPFLFCRGRPRRACRTLCAPMCIRCAPAVRTRCAIAVCPLCPHCVPPAGSAALCAQMCPRCASAVCPRCGPPLCPRRVPLAEPVARSAPMCPRCAPAVCPCCAVGGHFAPVSAVCLGSLAVAHSPVNQAVLWNLRPSVRLTSPDLCKFKCRR